MEVKGNFVSVSSVETGTYLADTGAANNYAVAPRPAITAYTNGLKITFQAANGNTGVSTLSVNGLAAKTIKKSVGTDLAAGDILANQILTVTYDGTNFQMSAGTGGGGGGSGASGYSGYSGPSGAGLSGFSGYSGPGGTGASGFSGYSGAGLSGFSGFSGRSGYSGYSGSGLSGYSGYSGSGISG
jgi:hypothetical protein